MSHHHTQVAKCHNIILDSSTLHAGDTGRTTASTTPRARRVTEVCMFVSVACNVFFSADVYLLNKRRNTDFFFKKIVIVELEKKLWR